mgnify:CR=1 FL=1
MRIKDMIVYADNAATTRVSRTAMDAMLPYFQMIFGNPSSLHRFGQAAGRALQQARETLACCIGAEPKEIRFTSGGSESDTQAILTGIAYGVREGRRKIVVSSIEHHAVLRAAKKAKEAGFSIIYLPVSEEGVVSLEAAAREITGDTALVSVMLANNETGVIQPVEAISELCRSRGALLHTDAVQAAGHIPVDTSVLGIDLLSVSAHKFHGPKGAGALYVRRGITAERLILGGGQERGERAGTETLPAIAGMAAALSEACEELHRTIPYVTELRRRLTDALRTIPGCHVYSDHAPKLPGITCVGFDGIRSEILLLRLDALGVAASSGSACTAGALEPSHVLTAMGAPASRAELRLSLDAENTPEEVDYIIEAVKTAYDLSASL